MRRRSASGSHETGDASKDSFANRWIVMPTARLRALLIDVDGTLLDSNAAQALAWVEALRRHGHAIANDRIRPLIGKGGDKLLDEAVDLDAASDEGKAIAADQVELFMRDRLPGLSSTRGARALLERLVAAGLQLVIATSAGGDQLEGLLKQAGVDDLIADASTSKDASKSKPDPDIVMAALRKAGLDAGSVLMIGDTPYDIEAARAAGVDTIALRCGGWWPDDALAGAVAIYDDPQALLDALDESPIGRRLAVTTPD